MNGKLSLIRIWQQNVNKSLDVQLDILHSASPEEYDLLAIQEPYLNHLHNTRATLGWRVIYPVVPDTDRSGRVRSVLLVSARISTTADCSEFAKGAKRTKKIEKSKKSENVEAGWESAFRCLCVLEPQQSAINRHIRAQWTFLRGIDDTCEMWMRSGAEIGRPDLRLRSLGTDCEWHL